LLGHLAAGTELGETGTIGERAVFCITDVSVAGFDKYKGGLDTVHDLTGLYSVYTNWRSIEIMFHVSTQLPYEKHDPQKVTHCSCKFTSRSTLSILCTFSL
jgi:hypothetical protein